jgi:hypothetical protein
MNMMFLSLVVALAVSAAPPPAVDQERPTFRRFGVEPEPGARIGVALPEALTTVDVEYWISTLDLKPEAGAALRAAVDDFYESRTHELRKVIEPVDRAAADLARRAGADLMRLADAPEAYRELVRLRDRAVSRFNSIEEDLFVHVAKAVSPDSPESVADVIRQLRKRSRYHWTPKLPMARVDLRDIESTLNRESKIEITDREAWIAARPSYDSELATLHERRIRLDLDLIVEDLEKFRDSGYDVDALVEYRTKQNRRQLAVERSIIAANRRWADAFAEMMSPADAERWRDAVRAATYPSLYPNPVDLRRLAQAVQALGASNSGVELEALKQTLVGEIARLASMESAVESELVAVAVSESRGLVVQGLREGLDETLARVRRERCETAARAIETCNAGPETRELPELALLISAMRTHCGEVGVDDSSSSSQGNVNADR